MSAEPTSHTLKTYNAEPTLALFHMDKSYFKYVEGPFGSGKSSGCLMEILMRAMRQQPDEHKVRRSRWAIVRQTYPELKTTTLKTYQHWIPESVAPVVMSIPMVSRFNQPLQDGTRVELEVVFLALDGPDDVKKLLSFELTGAYLNEAREQSFEIVENLTGRIGRYPETLKEDVLDAEGNTTYDENGKAIQRIIFGPTEPGLIADSNPPRTTHWLYEKFETGDVPAGWKKFKQPPAVYKDVKEDKWVLNPDAENLRNLDPKYYERQLDAGSDEFIKINLAGEFGMSRKGKPVFGKYRDSYHPAKEKLNPIRGFPVIMGIDFGLTPAAIFLQVTGAGVRLLDELPADDEMLEDFLGEYVQPLLTKRYQGFTIVGSGDPAGRNRSRLDKRTDFDLLRTAGIKAYPAHTNDPIARIGSVNWFLSRDGGFVISPHLVHTREAMAGGYVFKESRNNKGQVSDIPDKNEYSHIADALQYACMFARFGTRYITAKPVTQPKKPFLYA